MDAQQSVLALASADTDLAWPVLAIALVLSLLFLCLFLVKRFAVGGSLSNFAVKWRVIQGLHLRRRRSQQPDEVSIVAQLNLTPTHRLHVLNLRGRELVLVTHPNGCKWLSDEDPGAREFAQALEDERAR
jgi:hypothetical protein